MNDSQGASGEKRRTIRLPIGLQFSLFELLALILFAGLGAAALRSGGTAALILVQAALWLFTGIALAALIARGSWQAFAIGFVLGVAGYGIPALYVGQSELDPYTAQLPLTRALLPVWEAIQRPIYVDSNTGEEFEASEVTLVQANAGGSGGMPVAAGWNGTTTTMNGFSFYASGVPYPVVSYVTSDGRSVNPTEKPLRYQFMLVAHALLAIAIGYVFGKFAAVVYRRRMPKRDAQAPEEGDERLGGLTPSAQNER